MENSHLVTEVGVPRVPNVIKKLAEVVVEGLGCVVVVEEVSGGTTELLTPIVYSNSNDNVCVCC